MDRALIVDRRFHGPPDSGNGGYTCGRLAEIAGWPVTEVTLRKPIPIDKEMRVVKGETSRVLHLLRSADLIAVAQPGTLDLTPPSPPDFAVAAAASEAVGGRWAQLAFPTCFVCGHDRAEGDGLRLCTGRVGTSETFATTWIPAAEFAADNGIILPRFVWAALDCPGAFAALDGDTEKDVLLGRLTATVYRPVRPGERCVITAWTTGRDGRKHFCGTALYGEDGALAALAKAVWFEVV